MFRVYHRQSTNVVFDAASEQRVSSLLEKSTSAFALLVPSLSSGEPGAPGCICYWHPQTEVNEVRNHRRESAGAVFSRCTEDAGLGRLHQYRSAGAGPSCGAGDAGLGRLLQDH